MDTLNSWIDPAEVRRLATRLAKPLHETPVSVPDAGFDAGFVGFEATKSVPAPPAVPMMENSPFREPPVPAPEPPSPPAAEEKSPEEPEEIPESETAPAPAPPAEPAPTAPALEQTPAPPARSPFLSRVHRFRDWMHDHFEAQEIFILDKDGAVIFDESSHGRLHFLARSLAQASRRQGADGPGNVHVKIGTESVLEVLPVHTAYGWLILGAIVKRPLPQPSLASIADALVSTTEPERAPS